MSFITSNCQKIWRLGQPMSLIVSSIVKAVNEQNGIVNKCLGGDQIAKCRPLLVFDHKILITSVKEVVTECRKVIRQGSNGKLGTSERGHFVTFL